MTNDEKSDESAIDNFGNGLLANRQQVLGLIFDQVAGKNLATKLSKDRRKAAKRKINTIDQR